MLDGVIVGNNPIMGVDPWGLHKFAGTMAGTPTVMSCHPSENGQNGQVSLNGIEDFAQSPSGQVTIGVAVTTFGIIKKDPYITSAGYLLFTEGAALTAAQLMGGDTSTIPSGPSIVASIIQGIHNTYSGHNTIIQGYQPASEGFSNK